MEVLKSQLFVLRQIALFRRNAHLAFLAHKAYLEMYNNEGSLYEFIQKHCIIDESLDELNKWSVMPLIPFHISCLSNENTGQTFIIKWDSHTYMVDIKCGTHNIVGKCYKVIIYLNDTLKGYYLIKPKSAELALIKQWIDNCLLFSLQLPYEKAQKYFYKNFNPLHIQLNNMI